MLYADFIWDNHCKQWWARQGLNLCKEKKKPLLQGAKFQLDTAA